MFSRLPKLATVAVLACTIGLHWALLQSVAWVGMMVNYSQDAPLTEALLKTFDGKHPCCLCKAIAAAKKAEKKAEFPIQLKKLEFLTVEARFIFSAPTDFWRVTTAEDRPRPVLLTPPTPPPRGVLI